MTYEKLTISKWAVEDRPREKLIEQGATALSNAELLAILVGTGSQDENAVDMMRHVMKDCHDSLQELGRKQLDDLTRFKGLGPAKAVRIMAACELGRRRSAELPERQSIKSYLDAVNFFQPLLADLAHEECHIMLLRNNLTVITTKQISKGGLTESVVDIRLILQNALQCNATHLLLCHNHPSGNLQPSEDDKRLTKCLNEACRLINITLLDHIIVSSEGGYSFKEHNLI